MVTEELENPLPRCTKRAALYEGYLVKELILDAGCRVSIQGSLLTFMNRVRLLLIQLFLEVCEYLEELTFGVEPCSGLVGPHLGRCSLGRFFADVFDVNVWAGRRVDGPSASSGH